MKRILKIAGVVVVALLALAIIFNGHVIKNSINHGGPIALGVPVSVEKVRINLFTGILHIQDLVIGNPEGFKTDNMFNVHQIKVALSPRSLFTDTIVINEILVMAPEVTYESTLSGSNVGALQKQLEGEEKAEDGKKEEKTESGKKVVIERFAITDGQVSLSLPGMMGKAIPIPLPTVELKDIGKEKEGASITEAIGAIFGAIFSTIGDVVMSSGKLIGDGAKLVGEGAVAAGGAVVDGAAAIGKGVAGAVGGVLNVFSGSTNEAAENDTEVIVKEVE